MLRISNHTACRFAEKTRFFRSLWAGRRCAAASRFTFFKVETLYALRSPAACLFSEPGDGHSGDSFRAAALSNPPDKRVLGKGGGARGGGETLLRASEKGFPSPSQDIFSQLQTGHKTQRRPGEAIPVGVQFQTGNKSAHNGNVEIAPREVHINRSFAVGAQDGFQ